MQSASPVEVLTSHCLSILPFERLSLEQTPPTSEAPPAESSTNILNLLSTTVVLSRIVPHIPLRSLLALTATSRDVCETLCTSPVTFRYLDLSSIKSAIIDTSGPIDGGGISWRAERMDEALTEDDFYSGPIRGIFRNLERREWLFSVSTMILDGLTIPADVVREIIAQDRFNVRILSIREARQLNVRRLCEVLKYAVRPSRPAGTPKLRGLYVFGPKDPTPVKEEPTFGRRQSPNRSTSSRSSSLSDELNRRSRARLTADLDPTDGDKWYKEAGRLIEGTPITEWAQTLVACEGIIHFDAVLCRGPRHSPQSSTFLPAAVATIALGPGGCINCQTCPEGPAMFGYSPNHQLPLLAPPPLYGSSIRAAQLPSSSIPVSRRRLIARCQECLKNRWCERCDMWWCEACYEPASWTNNGQSLPQGTNSGDIQPVVSETIKVHMGLCVESCLTDDMAMEGSGYEHWPFRDGNAENGPAP